MERDFKNGILFIIIMLIIIIVNTIITNNLKQIICYKTLMNDDYIETACIKYFEKDVWYSDYTRIVRNQQENK